MNNLLDGGKYDPSTDLRKRFNLDNRREYVVIVKCGDLTCRQVKVKASDPQEALKEAAK